MRRLALSCAVAAAPGQAFAIGTSPPVPRSEAEVPGPASLEAWLAASPLVVLLTGAALLLALRRAGAVQFPLAIAFMAAATVFAAWLFLMVEPGAPVVMAVGDWRPPFSIVLAVDTLGALLVLVACLIGLVGLIYASAATDAFDVAYGFTTFVLLMVAGVVGAFTTGDVFNLYVWFEVFLVASFGLMVAGGQPIRRDAALRYAILNLVGTTAFLTAVGALYGLTGTLNMADVRVVLGDRADGPVLAVAALFLVAFGTKAAAIPLHFWLPASYHTAKAVSAALMAGLLTKVGVYALLRVIVMVLGGAGDALLPVLAISGGVTAVATALAGLGATDAKRLVAFLVASGIGLALVGVGIGTEDGLAGAIVYLVHSMIVMTGLYLALGVATGEGRGVDVHRGEGLWERNLLAASLFLVFALSTSGLPPFSGFWPKLILIEAALVAGGPLAPWLVAAVVLAGFLTTVALGRLWVIVYLKPGEAALAERSGRRTGALVLLAGMVLALGLAPSAMIGPAVGGAAALLDPAPYVLTVLPGEGKP